MEPQMILTIVLAVIACVVVGIVYYRLVTKERSGQQHAGAVNAAPGDDTPYSDRGANGAFPRPPAAMWPCWSPTRPRRPLRR